MSGESAGVNIDTVDDCKRRILDIVQGYSPDNIFNCDKTGLFFGALPDKTLSVNSDNTKGSRTSKERVTIILCLHAVPLVKSASHWLSQRRRNLVVLKTYICTA